MNVPVAQEPTRVPGKAVVWRVETFYASMTASPGAANSLSDAELAGAVAQSGAFKFLEHPEEDIYTLNDGREV